MNTKTKNTKYGAEDRADMPTPPSEEIHWLFKCGRSAASVKAKTWFLARRKAMILLGCGQDQLIMIENSV